MHGYQPEEPTKLHLLCEKFHRYVQNADHLTRDYLKEGLNLSVIDFNNGLQSLQNRYLVTKTRNNTILFQLSLVFREYVRNYCQN